MQQWFSTTAQMTIAIGEIEATDMQTETQFLADHPEERLSLLLEAEFDADVRPEGTLSRGGDALRMTVRMVDTKIVPGRVTGRDDQTDRHDNNAHNVHFSVVK